MSDHTDSNDQVAFGIDIRGLTEEEIGAIDWAKILEGVPDPPEDDFPSSSEEEFPSEEKFLAEALTEWNAAHATNDKAELPPPPSPSPSSSPQQDSASPLQQYSIPLPQGDPAYPDWTTQNTLDVLASLDSLALTIPEVTALTTSEAPFQITPEAPEPFDGNSAIVPETLPFFVWSEEDLLTPTTPLNPASQIVSEAPALLDATTQNTPEVLVSSDSATQITSVVSALPDSTPSITLEVPAPTYSADPPTFLSTAPAQSLPEQRTEEAPISTEPPKGPYVYGLPANLQSNRSIWNLLKHKADWTKDPADIKALHVFDQCWANQSTCAAVEDITKLEILPIIEFIINNKPNLLSHLQSIVSEIIVSDLTSLPAQHQLILSVSYDTQFACLLQQELKFQFEETARQQALVAAQQEEIRAKKISEAYPWPSISKYLEPIIATPVSSRDNESRVNKRPAYLSPSPRSYRPSTFSRPSPCISKQILQSRYSNLPAHLRRKGEHQKSFSPVPSKVSKRVTIVEPLRRFKGFKQNPVKTEAIYQLLSNNHGEHGMRQLRQSSTHSFNLLRRSKIVPLFGPAQGDKPNTKVIATLSLHKTEESVCKTSSTPSVPSYNRKRSHHEFAEDEPQVATQETHRSRVQDTPEKKQKSETAPSHTAFPYSVRARISRIHIRRPRLTVVGNTYHRARRAIRYAVSQGTRVATETMFAAKRLCVQSLSYVSTGLNQAQQALTRREVQREENNTPSNNDTSGNTEAEAMATQTEENGNQVVSSSDDRDDDSIQDYEWLDNPNLNKPFSLLQSKPQVEATPESRDDSDDELASNSSPISREESPVLSSQGDDQYIGLAGLLIEDSPEKSPLRLSLSERRVELRNQEQAERERKAREAEQRRIEEERLKAERLGRIPTPSEFPLFQHLSTELEQTVERALGTQNSHKQLALAFDGTPLHAQDFYRLRPGTWLNDELINAFVGLNVNRVKEILGHKRRETPKAEFFPSHFYSNLEAGQGTAAGAHAKVKRWASRKFIGGEDFLKCDLVVSPVNLGDSHWTLLAFWPKHRVVEFYNSFNNSASSRQVLALAKEYVIGELGSHYVESEWTFRTGKSPEQHNGYDCGVFTCTTAKLLLLGYEPEVSYSGNDMAGQRRRIAAELLNGGLEGELAVDMAEGWLR